jgi:hypothetical protein
MQASCAAAGAPSREPARPGPTPPGAILPRVIIDASREPRLQIDDGEPFAIDRCEIERDVEHSSLTHIVRDGEPVLPPPGARVTLWTGPNVVFVGRALDDHRVLDLLSTESDDELSDTETI